MDLPNINRRPSRTDQTPPPTDANAVPPVQSRDPNAAQVVGGLSDSAPLPPVPPQRAESDSAQSSTQSPRQSRSTLQAPGQVGAGIAPEMKRSASSSGMGGGFLNRVRSPFRSSASGLDRRSSDRESLTGARDSDPKASARGSPPFKNSRSSDTRLGGSSSSAASPAQELADKQLRELKETLTFQETRDSLKAHMGSEYSLENFVFLDRCNDLALKIADKNLSNQEKENAFKKIMDAFFNVSAKSEVNLSSDTKTRLKTLWREVQKPALERRNYDPLYGELDKAVDEVLRLVLTDTFARYKPNKQPPHMSTLDRAKGVVVGAPNPRPLVAARWPASFVNRDLTAHFEDQRAAKERRDLQKNQETQRPLGGSEMKFNPDDSRSSDLAAKLARELELSDDDSPKNSRANSGAMHAVFGSGSSSSSSGSTARQVQYGNTLAFQGSCQAYLDGTLDEKKAALSDIILHIDQNSSLFGDLAVLENLRLTLRMWSEGAVLVERKLNQLETLVIQMQEGSSTDSASSSSVNHQVYGDRAKFLVCCEKFLVEENIDAKKSKLAEILRHMDPRVAQFSFNIENQTTLRTRLAVWEGGIAPTAHQIDEMQGFVEQLQGMAL